MASEVNRRGPNWNDLTRLPEDLTVYTLSFLPFQDKISACSAFLGREQGGCRSLVTPHMKKVAAIWPPSVYDEKSIQAKIAENKDFSSLFPVYLNLSGASIESIQSILPRFPNIVRFSYDKPRSDVVDSLIQHTRELIHLDLGCKGQIHFQNEGLIKNRDIERIVERYPTLKSLSLRGNCLLDDSWLNSIIQLKDLRSLNISVCTISREKLRTLTDANLPLCDLNVSHTDVGNEWIVHIAACKALKKLDISENEKITDLSPLKGQLLELKELDMSRTGVLRFDFLQGLPKLKVLKMAQFTKIYEDLPRLVDLLQGLEELDLSYCNLRAHHCLPLGKLSNLRSLNLCAKDIYFFMLADPSHVGGYHRSMNPGPFAFLRNMKSLESLDLRGCADRSHVAEIKAFCPSLKVLKLTDGIARFNEQGKLSWKPSRKEQVLAYSLLFLETEDSLDSDDEKQVSVGDVDEDSPSFGMPLPELGSERGSDDEGEDDIQDVLGRGVPLPLKFDESETAKTKRYGCSIL